MRASRDVAKVSRHEAWRILGVLAVVFVLTSPDAARAATTTPSTPATKPAAAAKSTPTTTAPVKSTSSVAKSAPVTAPTATKTAPATAQASNPAHPAKATPTRTTTNPATAQSAAARPVASAPNVAVAARPSSIVPARNPKATTAVPSAPSIEEQVTYQYNALGRRDPFQPMIGGTFVGDDVGGDAPLDIGGLKVVGIVWGASDKFALVEDNRGQSSVLRAGDKVMNGVVETLKRDAVVVNLTVDGQTESVTIPLTRKGDQTNGNR